MLPWTRYGPLSVGVIVASFIVAPDVVVARPQLSQASAHNGSSD
jgi:hypothetical protein